ncbi:MAG: metal-dependent transcriptional regulator [Cytophagales bacterium]|nr:metal-dependent transcriptional regulator [Cytophagales bacterium]
MNSLAEENYLKAIYHLSDHGHREVSTNEISDALKTKPATVSDMLKKLSMKQVIGYVKYQGVTVTDNGKLEALKIIRKHRLWEAFLVSKLKFNWDEVHDIAEQLEHVQSDILIQRLDEFLGHPKFDPHGDPIPDDGGTLHVKSQKALSELQTGQEGNVCGVHDTSVVFLKYLDKIDISLNTFIQLVDRVEYDGSMEIQLDRKKKVIISKEVAKNIFISI